MNENASSTQWNGQPLTHTEQPPATDLSQHLLKKIKAIRICLRMPNAQMAFQCIDEALILAKQAADEIDRLTEANADLRRELERQAQDTKPF